VKKSRRSEKETSNKKGERPTLLELLAGFYQEAHEQFGVPLEISTAVRPAPVPGWGKKTVGQLGKTVLKPILKLRPSTGQVNFQNFGKTVGVISRGVTFFRNDVPQIKKTDGLDKIRPEQWEKIQPSDQTRAFVVEKLGRSVAQGEKLEDLENELFEGRLKHWEEMRAQASRIMAHRNAKETSLFLKGFEQGYGIFLDVEGQFCGDRGRTEIYIQLLSSMHEIEKMRRTLPPKKDADLYHHLKPWHRFPGATDEDKMYWLRKVCDDISLYMTDKPGRPRG
jgi:hypothetical protein